MKSSCSGNLPQSGTRSKVLRVAACLPCRVLLLSWEQEGEASPPAPKSWELEGCCRTNTPVPYTWCVQVLMGSAVLSKPICSFLLLLLAAAAFFFFFFFFFQQQVNLIIAWCHSRGECCAKQHLRCRRRVLETVSPIKIWRPCKSITCQAAFPFSPIVIAVQGTENVVY